MRTYFLNSQTEAQILQDTAHRLNNDGIAIVPTETVYGIMTRYDNVEGKAQIFRIKQRPQDRKLQMLAPSYEAALNAGVQHSRELQKIVQHFMPGELTIICPGITEPTVGLRIPKHPFLLKLIQQVGFPLAATSANLSGEPPANNAQDAIRNLPILPDILIDGGQVNGLSSTVISLLDPQNPQLLREGPIPFNAITDVLNQLL